MLAYGVYKASFCPCGCGLKADDTLSDERTGPQFRAHRTACRARMALIESQNAIAEANPEDRYGQARLWTVEKIGE